MISPLVGSATPGGREEGWTEADPTMGLLCAAARAGPTAAGGLRDGPAVGGTAAEAILGAPTAGAGAMGGAAAEAVLGPPITGAPRLELTSGGEGQGTEEFKLERERGVSESGREKVK